MLGTCVLCPACVRRRRSACSDDGRPALVISRTSGPATAIPTVSKGLRKDLAACSIAATEKLKPPLSVVYFRMLLICSLSCCLFSFWTFSTTISLSIASRRFSTTSCPVFMDVIKSVNAETWCSIAITAQCLSMTNQDNRLTIVALRMRGPTSPCLPPSFT